MSVTESKLSLKNELEAARIIIKQQQESLEELEIKYNCDVREVNARCDMLCTVNDELTAKLAKYEDAEEQGRLVVLPCKVGDKIFSFCWNIKSEKYEVHFSEIKNVRYDSVDGSVMVSDGERFHVWGQTVFLTQEEAEAALQEGRNEFGI